MWYCLRYDKMGVVVLGYVKNGKVVLPFDRLGVIELFKVCRRESFAATLAGYTGQGLVYSQGIY